MVSGAGSVAFPKAGTICAIVLLAGAFVPEANHNRVLSKFIADGTPATPTSETTENCGDALPVAVAVALADADAVGDDDEALDDGVGFGLAVEVVPCADDVGVGVVVAVPPPPACGAGPLPPPLHAVIPALTISAQNAIRVAIGLTV